MEKDKEKDKKKKKNVPKVWNESETALLKKWGEMASSYRLLHDKAFREYQRKGYGLTIPVIVMSTLSGTASFAVKSFPDNIQVYVPMVIGGINIIVGVIQTVTQFLRVNELTEAHRSASAGYGKFARNITTELSLPSLERSYGGLEYIQICRAEMDRLIEQSPVIPMHILKDFDSNTAFNIINKPDVLTVSQINEYKGRLDPSTLEIDEKSNKSSKSIVNMVTKKISNTVSSGYNKIKSLLSESDDNSIELEDIEKDIEKGKNVSFENQEDIKV